MEFDSLADIVCLDDSRVVLKPMPKFTGDFIHASWISHKFLEKKFICTQVGYVFLHSV